MKSIVFRHNQTVSHDNYAFDTKSVATFTPKVILFRMKYLKKIRQLSETITYQFKLSFKHSVCGTVMYGSSL